MRKLLLAVLLTSACAQNPDTPQLPAPPSESQLPPWQGARMANAPAVYKQVWEKAENKSTCAPIAFAQLGEGANATPRAATFSGGWSVAYDLATLRSAFGVAGTGVKAADPSYDEWPYRKAWSDGSTAGYGPEGGTGPNQLAYLRIAGQQCLYNVWSRLGRAHLETLLESIRFVQ